MDLSLTEEQEMLKAAVHRFVETEYPKEVLLEISATGQTAPSEPWQKLASTGWLGIIIPTEYGGEGGSFTDAGVLFEELGRGPVPGPHLSTAALGALAILEAGTEEQKRSLLPTWPPGGEPCPWPSPKWIINGTKTTCSASPPRTETGSAFPAPRCTFTTPPPLLT